MTYAIEYEPAALRQLRKLPWEAQDRVLATIKRLSSDPRPSGTKKIVGRKDSWRVRAGDYRIIYEIRDLALVVLVVRVAHRAEVYRHR